MLWALLSPMWATASALCLRQCAVEFEQPGGNLLNWKLV